MKQLLLFVCVGVGVSMSGQQKLQREFLAQIFEDRTDKIVYSEHVERDLKAIRKALGINKTSRKPDFGSWRGNTSAPNTITLSKSEIDFIMSELTSANKTQNWSKGLIRNSQLLTKTEIDSIYLDKAKGYPYFQKQYGNVLNTISKPVFLKNNTVCVFYLGSSGAALSGGGGFQLYVLDKGVWKSYRMLTMWVS